jgi:protein TonB
VAAPEGDAPPPSRSIEAGYVGALRAYLESIKRYPTSREARLQHPQGRVRLWLEVARDGTLRAAGIDESSGSMILDGAAVATVRQGRYPAFPAEAWRGAEMHRFAVTLEYKLDA